MLPITSPRAAPDKSCMAPAYSPIRRNNILPGKALSGTLIHAPTHSSNKKCSRLQWQKLDNYIYLYSAFQLL